MRHLRPFVRFQICVLLASFTLSSSALAQVQNGQITGVISDPSGAIVTHARVNIRNPATGYEADFETNESGIYSAPELIVGRYTIRAHVPGLRTATHTDPLLNART